MKKEEDEDWFPEERQRTKALASETLEDINYTFGDSPEVEFNQELEYYKDFLRLILEHIDDCDNLTYVFMSCGLEFMLGDSLRVFANSHRSAAARKSAQSSRKSLEAIHNEIRRIGKSVIQTANEREVTPIVEHRLEKLGYKMSRRTIRTSLQKAGIIRKQADRKKGK